MDADWPYAADRNHPLAARRVPVIATFHPDYRYEVALVIGSFWAEGDSLYASDRERCIEPTALEADLIVACIDYRMRYYNASWAARMRERPLDTDGSTNTVIFGKTALTGGWLFRRDSWEHGPIPFYNDPNPVRSLPDIIDRCWRIGGGEPSDFTAWKAEHAGLLAAVRAEWTREVA